MRVSACVFVDEKIGRKDMRSTACDWDGEGSAELVRNGRSKIH